MKPNTERLELRVEAGFLADIDAWRARQKDIPTRTAAVRRLVKQGLEQSLQRRAFTAMKSQILIAACQSGGELLFSDANVFAWDREVYPFHESQQETWATPFSDSFRVGKEHIEELAGYLDDSWLKEEVVSFYSLEERYEVSHSQNNWDRTRLIDACRYMFLRDMFDDKFWEGLLKPGEYPIEARSITLPFNRKEEILLG